jgi:hypothetical protein
MTEESPPPADRPATGFSGADTWQKAGGPAPMALHGFGGGPGNTGAFAGSRLPNATSRPGMQPPAYGSGGIGSSGNIGILQKHVFSGPRGGRFVGLLVHHTSLACTPRPGLPAGLAETVAKLKERGLSVQYYISPCGEIVQLMPPGTIASHAGRLENVRGLGNHNLIGVELGAKNGERDVTPQQRDAVAYLLGKLSKQYGWNPRKAVFGHGELTRRKERDEGATAKMIRSGLIPVPV